MAYTYGTVKALFTAICNAIRAKDGTVEEIDHQDIPDRISKIETNLEAQLYTDDGKSRLLIEVEDGGTFKCAGNTNNNRKLLINWGDGTTETTPDEPFSGTFLHTYETGGQYLITFESLGDVAGTAYRFAATLKRGNDRSYLEGRNTILGVSLGRNAYLSSITVNDRSDLIRLVVFLEAGNAYAFGSNFTAASCVNLRFVDIIADEDVQATTTPLFQSCDSLPSIKLPPVTSIKTNTFSSCYSLKDVYLPPCVTTINNNAFNTCYGLTNITLPESLATLNKAFSYSTNLESVIITREDAVTTASASDLFALNTKIEKGEGHIYVPDALLTDYQAATNWTKYSAQMVPWSQAPDWVKGILVERGHTVS